MPLLSTDSVEGKGLGVFLHTLPRRPCPICQRSRLSLGEGGCQPKATQGLSQGLTLGPSPSPFLVPVAS